MIVPEIVRGLIGDKGGAAHASRGGPAVARVRIRPEHIATVAEVTQIVANDLAQGWVCYPGGVYNVGQSAAVAAEDRLVGPLSAELFVDGESVVVRLGADGWHIVRIDEKESEKTVDALYFEQTFLSTEPGRSHLYRVYWCRAKDEPSAPWRPRVAAFRGWGEVRAQ